LRAQPVRGARTLSPRRGGGRNRLVRVRRPQGQATPAGARRCLAVRTSEDARSELARIAPVRECDRRAELSALFHSAGRLHLRGRGEWALHLDFGSGAVARRAFALLREEGVRSEIRTYPRRAFDRATRYQLHLDVGPDEAVMLREAGVLSASGAPVGRPPKRVVGRPCCRSAYLRGALLGGGSVSGPGSPHLE